jgi:pentatricopeptide repeat protein
MMMGCSKEGLHGEALDLFANMCRSVCITYSSPSLACSVWPLATSVGNLRLGQQILGLVDRATSVHNVFINNSLLDFYSKCDCLGDMEKLFDKMPERDNVCTMSSSQAMLGTGATARRCGCSGRCRRSVSTGWPCLMLLC